MKAVLGFINEIKSELPRVTWPKKDQVIKLTATVLLVSAILGLYVGGFDYLFTTLLTKVLTK